jgi:muramoyltetrapeptide carboxypeptidase
LGAFNRFKPAIGHDRGYGLKTVVHWLRQQLNDPAHQGVFGSVPVFSGLPFGHVPTKVLLPVGRSVDLVWQGRDVLLFWDRD